MSRTDVEVLMASNAALNRLDVEGMLANYAEDATVVDSRRMSLGSFSGLEELRGLYNGLVGSAADMREDVEVLAAQDRVIAAHCKMTARLASDQDGHVVGAEYGFVVTVRADRIARLELFEDGEAALEASGLTRSAESA